MSFGPIGGYDPTQEPYGGELQGLPAPPTAVPLDGKPPLAPVGSGVDHAKIAEALKMVVPVIAALYSAKSGGGIGGFMQGFSHGEEQNNLNKDRLAKRAQDAEELKFQRDREKRVAAEQLRQHAEAERKEAAKAEAKAQALALAKQERERAAIVHAFDKATASNPGFMKKLNRDYKEGHAHTITVPGVGEIDVREAFDRMGGMHDPAGDMLYGDEEPAATKPTLTTGVDAQGNPIRVEDKPGVRPWVRPRAPKEPKAAPRPRLSLHDMIDPDDPSGPKIPSRVNLDTGEITRLSGTAAATAAPAVPASKYTVGQTVKLKDGRAVVIKKINPDGTFDY